MMGGYGGWGMGIFGIVAMVLFVVLVVGGIYVLIRAADSGNRGRAYEPPHGYGPAARPDAVEILAERFANGDLSVEEFEERRKVLEAQPR